MKKSEIKKVLNLTKEYLTKVILVFGVFTLLDFLLFEKVIDNEVISSNLWISPFMAFFLLILNRVMPEKDREAITHVVDGEKI